MYGHKTVFVIGWVWFAIMSLVTGFSYMTEDIVLFSVCRALQGIGPALLVPNAIALLGMNFPVGIQRNTAFACFGAAGPLGATAGAVFTALIADLFWWPWSFWILAIVCVIVCVLSIIIVPGPVFQSLAPKSSRPTFDYWGCVTGVSGLILINFALNQAPLDDWTTWYIYTTLILGFACICAFVVIELNFTEYPLVPLRGLGSEAYFALGCIAAGWGSHGIWAYYLYLFLEQVRGHGALLTAAQTSPVAITGIFFALSTVWLVKKIGVAYVMLIAMVNFLIGSLLLALVPLHQSYWIQTFLSIIIMPGAMNLSFPAATILLSSALPKEKQGIAASLVSTMVNYCISCGLGLAGSIHRKSFENALRRHGGPDHRVPKSKLPLLTANLPGLDVIRIESFRGPWFFAVGLSFIGVLIAICFIIRTRRKTMA
jgi:MFS family permease